MCVVGERSPPPPPPNAIGPCLCLGIKPILPSHWRPAMAGIHQGSQSLLPQICSWGSPWRQQSCYHCPGSRAHISVSKARELHPPVALKFCKYFKCVEAVYWKMDPFTNCHKPPRTAWKFVGCSCQLPCHEYCFVNIKLAKICDRLYFMSQFVLTPNLTLEMHLWRNGSHQSSGQLWHFKNLPGSLSFPSGQ